MRIWRKIKALWHFYISLPSTIYFNFKHFKISQAIKLPVFLYYPRIIGNGEYIIEGPVKRGMIRMGFPYVSIYRRKGVSLENYGKITFRGRFTVGGDSGISVGKTGHLICGDEFGNSYGIKIVCYNKIECGRRVRIGWSTLLCDTDLHRMKNEDSTIFNKGYGNIRIEDEVWIGSYCKLYKNTYIPSRCTVASNTLLNKRIDCEPYSLIYADTQIKIKHTGLYRDIDDDNIDYRQ